MEEALERLLKSAVGTVTPTVGEKAARCDDQVGVLARARSNSREFSSRASADVCRSLVSDLTRLRKCRRWREDVVGDADGVQPGASAVFH